MASSRKSNSIDFVDRVAAQIAPLLPAQGSIVAGLSGGVDSVVLLHVLRILAQRFCWQLSALHVHHGISPHADAWTEFCSSLCAGYHLPLSIEKVDIAPLRAHGIEAAARKLRHAVFAAQPCDFVALAHHADDQAETLLLQLLRGAGVRGASAMPFVSEGMKRPRLMRPLLNFSRREILDYAEAQGLRWIEDESNADDQYPRNFLRHRVLPLLDEKFPAYRGTLMRSAGHFAEAGSLLDDLAQQDAGQALEGETLAVSALQALSQPRAKNLLRYFLHCMGAPMPQAGQLQDMLQQLCHARKDAAVCIAYDGWQVRRYQRKIYLLRALDEFEPGLVLRWQGEAELHWAALDMRVQFKRSQGSGIRAEKLRQAPVTLRLRRGGETLRPHSNGTMRTLKNLLQEHYVPPWQRERLPLVYCGEELVCVPGVAIAADFRADAGAESISIQTGALRK